MQALTRAIGTSWKGASYSKRIWGNAARLAETLNEEITAAYLSGKSNAAIEQVIMDRFGSSFREAERLVRTETSYVNNRAALKSYADAGLEQYEFLTAKDSRTCKQCSGMDGKVVVLVDAEVGVNMPPLHPFCRCTVLPVVDEERLGQAQPAPISEKDEQNDYSVDRTLVNSKQYHDKYEGLTERKPLNEGLYKSSLEILEHRDGTPYEDIYLLDARTGEPFVKATQSTKPFRSGLTREQYDTLQQHKGSVVILHSHPQGGRFSYTDILNSFKEQNVIANVSIGHNGEVHIMADFNRRVDVDRIYQEAYNDAIRESGIDALAKHKANNALYTSGAFSYRKR